MHRALGILFTVVMPVTLSSALGGTAYEEYLERALSPQTEPLDLPGIQCQLASPTACPPHHCCVKEVISYQDLDKDMEVRTKCQPFRTIGQLCLRKTEGYMCDCAEGLRCGFQNNETYGHCAEVNVEEEKRKGKYVT